MSSSSLILSHHTDAVVEMCRCLRLRGGIVATVWRECTRRRWGGEAALAGRAAPRFRVVPFRSAQRPTSENEQYLYLQALTRARCCTLSFKGQKASSCMVAYIRIYLSHLTGCLTQCHSRSLYKGAPTRLSLLLLAREPTLWVSLVFALLLAHSSRELLQCPPLPCSRYSLYLHLRCLPGRY